MDGFKDILELYGPAGIGVMVAIFVIKEAMVPWLRRLSDSNGNGKNKRAAVDSALLLERYRDLEKVLESIRDTLKRIDNKLEETHRICLETFNLHDVRDAQGNPVWWTTEVRIYVQEIAANIEKVVDGLEQVIRTNEEYSGLLHQLQEAEAQRRISEAREQGRREGLRERK